MLRDVSLYDRQLWNYPASTTKDTSTLPAHCTPFMLPSNGVITFAGTTISLTTDVVFRPVCTGGSIQDVSTISDNRDPFYASTIPQTFVIAATTVIAWILVIMLIITPRTNFLGQSGSAPGFSSGHGIIGGATGGNTNLIGVGSRPWLQKVAALTVAISLTIATADTLECAKEQYHGGYMDAAALRDDVLGSLEIRITRVVSDIFLWLAQVQTLIRLFPRHKEKVLIKWIGFALIMLDSLFSCLNSFAINKQTRIHSPRDFVDAIPALSYLFELALGLLYAAWVMYYSLTKRRYAFYHQKMPSISLIALLSLVAILTPVVFFVIDVSNQDIAGWGDYFRWVGAAAASVIVWEWVERIEALERDEKKDGILGREVFDGDEMLDVNPSGDVILTQSRYEKVRYRREGDDGSDTQSSALEKGLTSMAQSFRRRTQDSRKRFLPARGHSQQTTNATEADSVAKAGTVDVLGALSKPREPNEGMQIIGPTPPPAIASPVSRADTTSAASTIYMVRHNPNADFAQPVRRRVENPQDNGQGTTQTQGVDSAKDPEKEEGEGEVQPNKNRTTSNWLSVANPFKRKRASPPAEVQQARQNSTTDATRHFTQTPDVSRWNIKNRFSSRAAPTEDKWREGNVNHGQVDSMPVTVIPAQPRGSGRTWTPASMKEPDQASSSGRSGEGGSSNEHWSASSAPTALESRALSPQRSSDPSQAYIASPRSPEVTSEPSRSPPPRADELRPVGDRSSPTIIPAPNRRSVRSPLSAIDQTSTPHGEGEIDQHNE